MTRRLPPKGRKPTTAQRKPPPKKKCIACGGTGQNSKGNPCYPCSIKDKAK